MIYRTSAIAEVQKEVRMRYRRSKVEGASCFCTVNLADSSSPVLVDHVDERRNVMCKQTWGAGLGPDDGACSEYHDDCWASKTQPDLRANLSHDHCAKASVFLRTIVND